jgi:hypothetical protein
MEQFMIIIQLWLILNIVNLHINHKKKTLFNIMSLNIFFPKTNIKIHLK